MKCKKCYAKCEDCGKSLGLKTFFTENSWEWIKIFSSIVIGYIVIRALVIGGAS